MKPQTKSDKKIDEMLGGAIDAPVGKGVQVAPEAIQRTISDANAGANIHRLLQDMARQEFASQLQLQTVADSLHDYRPRNVIGYDQYIHHFHAFPEEQLISGIEKSFSGHGASKDHPKLHQLFMDSFQHHPELVSLYTNR